MRFYAFCAALFLSLSSAHAQDIIARPLTAECLKKASDIQGVSSYVILGLLKTEGGHIGSASRNTNGTYDLGPMQVNTTWVPRLAEANFNGNRSQTYQALRYDGCYNVFVGTWVFRQYLDEADGNYARAIGYYNSHTPSKMNIYQHRFAKNFKSVLTALSLLE